MTRTSELKNALRASAGKAQPAQTEPLPRTKVAERRNEASHPQSPASRPASREGKVNISGWFDPAYKRSLRMVQAVTDKKLEPLLAEALNDLFAKYDVPQVRGD